MYKTKLEMFVELIGWAVIGLSVGWLIAKLLAPVFIQAGTDSRRIECFDLQSQSIEFKANGVFYITDWQDEMCKDLGIIIDAPVYKTE